MAYMLVCFLSLAALVGGSTVQQELDLLCANSYADFEGGSVGSNVSGKNIRDRLYEAFYPPNYHFPYFVFVTYQLVLDNGTRFNLSSESNCSELWMWVSSPVFLRSNVGLFYWGTFLIFTLDFFTNWDPPHVNITTTIPPCPNKTIDFLSAMTASVSSSVSNNSYT